jgi:hypothetical protein
LTVIAGRKAFNVDFSSRHFDAGLFYCVLPIDKLGFDQAPELGGGSADGLSPEACISFANPLLGESLVHGAPVIKISTSIRRWS